jgi:hypothetical protein
LERVAPERLAPLKLQPSKSAPSAGVQFPVAPADVAEIDNIAATMRRLAKQLDNHLVRRHLGVVWRLVYACARCAVCPMNSMMIAPRELAVEAHPSLIGRPHVPLASGCARVTQRQQIHVVHVNS